jgi:trigger factor
MREDYQPEAEKRVKVALILDKIAKAENLTVDDAEVDDKIMEMAREMGQTPAAVRDFYNNDNRMEGLREGLSSEKTLRFVLDHATIKDVEPTPQVQD